MPRYENTFLVKLIPLHVIQKIQEELFADEDLKSAKITFEQREGPFGVMLAGMFVLEDVTFEKGSECYERAMNIYAKYNGTSASIP